MLKLAADGASIIEIGAQSTRPGAVIAGPDQEYNKLKPVLDNIIQFMQDRTLTISIDTFWPSVISKLLENYPVAYAKYASEISLPVYFQLKDDEVQLIIHAVKVAYTKVMG